MLLLQGRKPPDSLHYVYAVSPLVIALVTEAMRAGAAARELDGVEGDPDALPRREQVLLARRVVVREIGIMTVGVILVVVTLLLRAAQSGGRFLRSRPPGPRGEVPGSIAPATCCAQRSNASLRDEPRTPDADV